MVARLNALPLVDARSFIDHHRACIRALDREPLIYAAGCWMYDNDFDAFAIVPLLGEPFYRRVVVCPGDAAVLEGASELAALGGWRVLAEPVSARWRAALHAAIPACFADVAYPGDDDVISSDWATDEECRYFCGKDWRAIDRSTLYPRHADLCFVKARGLHYLLPAFLLAAIEDPDGRRVCGLPITDSLLSDLSHGCQRQWAELLSLDQRRVLADVLRLRYERWRRGPLAEPEPDLGPALSRLDLPKPFCAGS